MTKHLSILILFLLPTLLFSLPGDTLFIDDFERATLGTTDWTTSDTSRAEIGTQTSNSGTSSLYTRNNTVSVTSRNISLAVDGAILDVWIRRGDDTFSENPENGEDLIIEYLDDTSTWKQISSYGGGDGNPGDIFTLSYQFPPNALYSNFQLRLRQTSGSGVDWDYWHVDDITITETGFVAPPPVLKVGQCDEFEGDLSNWTVNNSSRVNITTATAKSPSHNMSFNGSGATSTSISMDTTTNFKELLVWVRSGDDSFSENPDNGEDMVLEYLNDVGTWITLETFAGGSQGTIWDRTYTAPADSQHANFQIRFTTTAGSNNFDYWHIDDVCLVPNTYATITRTSCVISDPINGTTNPKRIPGATIRYAEEVTNITDFVIDNPLTSNTLGSNSDATTINNLQIIWAACDCKGVTSANNNGANGSAVGVNPITLDYTTIPANSIKCGYFEANIL